jgi:hypothetical protein
MSILNRPSDGLFNVLIAILRCLVHSGPSPEKKLIDLCGPTTAVSSQDQAKKTLNRWVELGLLVNDADTIAIASDYAKRLSKKFLSNSVIASVAREVTLNPTNNERFWEAEGNRSADFTRAVSWMLAQDIYAFQPTSHAAAEKLESLQLSDAVAFTNDTRWSGFKSWAHFLGFGFPGYFPSNVFVIDPTSAIHDVVGGLFGSEHRLPISRFLRELAEKLPVLDGGEYRIAMEDKIDKKSWQRPGAKQISQSLSRALLRLRDSGDLRLEDNSDAERFDLLGREFLPIQTVSHIVWKGGKR